MYRKENVNKSSHLQAIWQVTLQNSLCIIIHVSQHFSEMTFFVNFQAEKYYMYVSFSNQMVNATFC